LSPTEELAVKQRRVTEFLEREGLDGVLLTRRCNFSWYTGGGLSYVNLAAEPGVATLLITRDGAVCLSANIEAGRMADEEVGDLGIEVVGFPWHDASAAAKTFADRIGSRGVAADVRLPSMPDTVGSLSGGFDQLRWSLTAAEVERYRALGRDVAEVVETVSRECRPGQCEYELGATMIGSLGARDIRTWVCLVAADGRIARYRHPIPTDRPIERAVMLVACGERGGLICSITRLVSFGAIDADLARRHRAVCAVDAAMIRATRPGTTLGGVWDAAVRAYADAGFPEEWQHHHQGGPTGYLTREAKATPGSTLPVYANQAFAWNPSIAGTKSEDTVLVSDTKFEILTAASAWPSMEVEAEGETIGRADILVR